MTRSKTGLWRKLLLLALIVGALLFSPPARRVGAYEECIPEYNSCRMMCDNMYGEYGYTPDEQQHATCHSGCMSAFSRCQMQISPEERDE